MCDPITLSIGASIATAVSSAGTAIAGGAAAGSLMGAIGGGLMTAGAAMGSAAALTGVAAIGLGATAIGVTGAALGGAFNDRTGGSSSAPVSPQQLQASKQVSASNSGIGVGPNRSILAALSSQGVKTSTTGLGAAPVAKKTALGL